MCKTTRQWHAWQLHAAHGQDKLLLVSMWLAAGSLPTVCTACHTACHSAAAVADTAAVGVLMQLIGF